jgi:hypothetical protein
LAVPSIYVHLSLRLRPGEDDDLIKFFSQIPLRRRPSALKAALRAGGMSADTTRVAEADDDKDFAAGFLA